MREKIPQQRTLNPGFISHDHSILFREISKILDAHPELLVDVSRDLTPDWKRVDIGRPGISAELALRALIVKQLNGFSYSALAFHLQDSTTYQAFCRISPFESAPKRSTLGENLGRISATTLEKINRLCVIKEATASGIESGKKVRVDSSVVESNIHAPTDSSLLLDAVRTLTRFMGTLSERFNISFVDHTRRAKRRALAISNTKPQQKSKRRKFYRDLIVVAGKSVSYASDISARLKRWPKKSQLNRAEGLEAAKALDEIIGLSKQVIDQADRRVLRGEAVPVADKIVSLFEPHTDIIKKGAREVEYGHKIFLTTGASCLVTDCVIERGNPADPTMAIPMIARQIEIYGKPPRQTAFDGGFASVENLSALKNQGVEDVAFHKKKGLEIGDMARSPWVYQQLRNFRAGIEGCISFLKRCFGLNRCIRKGMEAFKAFVWSGVVTANLVTLARHRLAREKQRVAAAA